MTVPNAALRRGGMAFTDDGALYVSLASGGVQVLAQSAVAVSGAADTAENTLATISVPANAMGPNGMLRIWTSWTLTNDASAKTLRVRFSGAAGTQYLTFVGASNLTLSAMTVIHNRNATNSQVSASTGGIAGLGTAGNALVTSAVDTTAATTIVITGEKADGTDTLTLERYLVELLYGA